MQTLETGHGTQQETRPSMNSLHILYAIGAASTAALLVLLNLPEGNARLESILDQKIEERKQREFDRLYTIMRETLMVIQTLPADDEAQIKPMLQKLVIDLERIMEWVRTYEKHTKTRPSPTIPLTKQELASLKIIQRYGENVEANTGDTIANDTLVLLSQVQNLEHQPEHDTLAHQCEHAQGTLEYIYALFTRSEHP